MNTDSVSTAFDIIIEEMAIVISDVNSRGAAFLQNGDYVQAESAIASGRRMSNFRDKVESLRAEWIDSFDESTRQQVQLQTGIIASKSGHNSKSSATVLVVKLPDGCIVYEPTAAATFATTLVKLGIERVAALGMKVNAVPLVSKQRSQNYSQTEVEGYYVMTHSNTMSKRQKLIEIAKALGVQISVDIVPSSSPE